MRYSAIFLIIWQWVTFLGAAMYIFEAHRMTLTSF